VDDLAVVVPGGQLVLDDVHVDPEGFTVAFDLEGGAPQRGADRLVGGVPIRYGSAIHGHDPVTGQDPGLGRGGRIGPVVVAVLDLRHLGRGDALGDLGNGGVLLRHPDAHEQHGEQDRGKDHVHAGAGAHDDDPLPGGTLVELPVLVLGGEL